MSPAVLPGQNGHYAHVPSYDRFRRDAADLQAAHPDVELHPVWTGPDAPVTLDLIRTMPALRGHGLADAALRDLTDAWTVRLRLVVEPIEGDHDIDPARLLRWYASHGFIVSGVRERDSAPVMERPVPGHP